MVKSQMMLKKAPVALFLMALVASGQGVERLASCCTSVSNDEITEPILGYMIQERNLPCVNAVIFQTNSSLYCSRPRAPWVFPKIKELRAKARSTLPSSSASHLSIVTSTSSSSTLLSSSSSFKPVTAPEVTSSFQSLLSIVTSTASPSLSSALPSSSSSSSIYSDFTPTKQADETFWDILSSSASPSTPADEEMSQTSADETMS